MKTNKKELELKLKLKLGLKRSPFAEEDFAEGTKQQQQWRHLLLLLFLMPLLHPILSIIIHQISEPACNDTHPVCKWLSWIK